MTVVASDLKLKLSLEEKAYLAGFFDGEGCINATITTKRYFSKKKGVEEPHYVPKIQLIFTNNDRSFLEYIRKTFGFGGIYSGTERGAYTYRIGAHEEVLSVLEALIAHIKTTQKKKHMEIAKDALIYILSRHGAKWTTEEINFFKTKYKARLDKMTSYGHRFGRKKINKW